jgi:hypothetical protein
MLTQEAIDALAERSTDYEFSSDHDQTFDELGRLMRDVGRFYTVVGVLFGLGCAFELLAGRWAAGVALALAVVTVFQGVRTRRAGDSFVEISASQGRDIAHLFDALDDLYAVHRALGAAYIALLAVVVLATGAVLLPR